MFAHHAILPCGEIPVAISEPGHAYTFEASIHISQAAVAVNCVDFKANREILTFISKKIAQMKL